MNERVSLDRLTVFSFLLASAAIFEQAKWDRWASSPAELVVSASAFWLFLRPRSLPGLVILLLSFVWNVLQRLPWTSNHSFVVALAATTVLASLALKVRAEGWPPDRERWFDAFAPAVRIEVVVVYFWAFFHKLNAGWFDPEVSCAVVLADVLGGRLGLPDAGWLHGGAILAGLAAELAIPVLLLFTRTRGAGVLVAAGFHWLLGIATFFNFSAWMYGLLFLFLPTGSTDHLRGWLKSLRGRALCIASPVGIPDHARRGDGRAPLSRLLEFSARRIPASDGAPAGHHPVDDLARIRGTLVDLWRRAAGRPLRTALLAP
jgi:hypothetical protein